MELDKADGTLQKFKVYYVILLMIIDHSRCFSKSKGDLQFISQNRVLYFEIIEVGKNAF
ncbi:hypothetical protein Syun_027824 [Stephania yunnanensis]|uniref:Uncharacterized protein n=1 Tax=Stephania yunnanensis TaxID=152371 RepID=A0AAP0ELS7_9MAGN